MSGAPAPGAKGSTETPKVDDAAAAAAAAAAATKETPAKETPAAGAKTEEQGAKGEEGKGKETPPASGAPETYKLSIPDDAKDLIDDADLKAFEAEARTAGLSNDDAQAAMKEHIESVKAASAKFLADTKADATYGGDKLAETQRLAKVGVDLIRPDGHTRRDSFMKFLKRVGADNHIEVVSFLADLGRRASEDGTGATNAGLRPMAKTVEQKLYDSTPVADGGSKQ